jgi:NitT/TauT family transport system substrate-binding protein
VQRYFRALQRAQRDIDVQPERYKHYFLKALPEKYHSLVDLHAFGVGERLVFEPYTREHFEQTHRWMAAWDLFDSAAPQQGRADYAAAVLLLGDG